MERIFRTVRIKDRLPNMGQRVMFLDEGYKKEYMHEYNPNEIIVLKEPKVVMGIEVKKGKYIEIQNCHFVTDYLIKNFTHWLEEVTPEKASGGN